MVYVVIDLLGDVAEVYKDKCEAAAHMNISVATFNSHLEKMVGTYFTYNKSDLFNSWRIYVANYHKSGRGSN